MEDGSMKKGEIICPEIKKRVMEKIKERKIKMRKPFIFMAEKWGLEAALIITILVGGFIVGLFFYFIRKSKVLKFLKLGISGFKVFLLSLPFYHMIFFFLVLVLAVFIIHKLGWNWQMNMNKRKTIAYFIFATVFVAFIGGFMISEERLDKLNAGRIPENMAVSGKIWKIEGNNVWIVNEFGQTIQVTIVSEDPRIFELWSKKFEGKFMRAVGTTAPVPKGDTLKFQAQQVLCCDED